MYMPLNNRHLARIIAVCVLVAVVVLIIASPFLFFRLAFSDYYADLNATRERLLNDVNYEQTLREAKQLMGDYPAGEVFQWGDERLPENLRQLSPNSVQIGDGKMWIEFAGGFHHMGFLALSRGVEPGDGPHISHQLIDGLWFYEGE